jgi:hypothetical protein
MNIRQTRELPAGLESVRRRLEQWRQTHKVRSRLPAPLWAAAVKAAGIHGIHRTARALRLDYYVLKKRMEQNAANSSASEKRATPAFIELAPHASAGSCECILELEDVGGSKMRIELKGIALPDMESLCRSLWNHRP